MRTEEVIGICKGIIEPLSEKYLNISEKLCNKIELLASKSDIDQLISKLESRFQSELEQRDKRIHELECRIIDLEGQNISTTDKFMEFRSQISLLENNIETQIVERSSTEIALDINTKEELELAVVGDSITKYIQPDTVRPDVATKNVFKRGGHICDAYVQVCELNDQYNVKELILHTGSNHIPEQDPLSVAYELLSAIDRIKQMMPQTKLYVSAILPKHHVSFIPGINIINRHLYNVRNMVGFEFIQHRAFCARGIVNERLYAIDRIHPSYSGSRQLENDFREALL